MRFKNAEKIKIGDDVEIRAFTQLYCQSNTMNDSKFPDLAPNMILENGVHIKECVNLSTYGGFIRIGERSNIGQNCVLYGQGGIDIGEDVLIGPNCTIVSGSHLFEKRDLTINRQKTCDLGIKIENDVWIGANVVVLDGVTIGEGSVIGASALVKHSVPPYSVAYGVPAKVQRLRGK